MNKTLRSRLLLSSLVTALVATACNAQGNSSPKDAPAGPAPKDTVWIDVRSPGEYEVGHLPGALNIPLDVVVAGVKGTPAIDNKHLALYCRSGRRSGLALEALQQAGFRFASNQGGISDVLATRKAEAKVGTQP